MASMHLQHDQGRGPWILLHVVSGPWTSFLAVHDKDNETEPFAGDTTHFKFVKSVINFKQIE